MRMVAGDPTPRYPSILQSAGVEGRVLAQFAVDTLGHADMNTCKVLQASRELFAQAVRRVLLSSRFFPAEGDRDS